MNGRERIEAAFSPAGTPEIGAVICYEDLYVRDHWRELTLCPWWYAQAPEIERQLLWQRDVIAKTGQDWFILPSFWSREERRNLAIELRRDGVYRIDRASGEECKLQEPQVAGWSAVGEPESVHPAHLAETPEEIEALIPAPPQADPMQRVVDGRGDLAAELLKEFGGELFPISSVSSPLWSCYHLWGYEEMMTRIATRPELVAYACERSLAKALYAVREAASRGVRGIWIEECLTDMIGPRAFAALNGPYVRAIIEAIREAGMRSIYYYCGDPAPYWEQILALGADALALEESKKGFVIDIAAVAERVDGRMTLFGNLDAIHLLPTASEEELRAEIARQMAAGRRNHGRFVMSLGSPVTPGTSVACVRRYCELAHELGR